MRCPSCGAVHSSEQCPESAAPSAALPSTPVSPFDHGDPLDDQQLDILEVSTNANHSSRLIEFPGVSRPSLPAWRKELSKRVREVQERRAREAALADEEAEKRQGESLDLDLDPAQPQLELLPQTEPPEVNPIVTAALRRIERAHQSTPPATTTAASLNSSPAAVNRRPVGSETGALDTAAAVSPVARTTNNRQMNTSAVPAPRAATAAALDEAILPINEPAPLPERSLNLVVAQAPVAVEAATAVENSKPKPKRLIADNDPVLHYLDSIGTKAEVVMPTNAPSPVISRLAAGFVDLLAVAFLSLPFAAALELQNANWLDHRVAGVMAGIVTVVMFIYLTVSIALTGRTLGLKLFSLRAIDVKTGLIPTGKQSASRAFLFMLSLATLGIGFCVALINSERRAVHDRLSRTAVVRI